MNTIAVTMAKLAGLLKTVSGLLENPAARYFDPLAVIEFFEAYNQQSEVLRDVLPALFADLPLREIPQASGTTDNDGRGYIERKHLARIERDIEYIFEVRSNSELSVPENARQRERRVFISHGRAADWREVQAYVEKDIGIPTLELAQQANRGRTILQKLSEESDRCGYAIIVMTGEDKTEGGEVRARENVMHEIGYFQGKLGLANVCLLHEEGVSMPSNIHGLVYVPFPKNSITATFGVLSRELRAAFG